MDIDREEFDRVIQEEVVIPSKQRSDKMMEKFEDLSDEDLEKAKEVDDAIFNEVMKRYVIQSMLDWMNVYEHFADEEDIEDLKTVIAERYEWEDG